LDLRAPLLPSAATGAVVSALRERVPGPDVDRWLAPEIEAAFAMTRDGAFVDAAQQVVGVLA
jgi:histidine ammonia-lyase